MKNKIILITITTLVSIFASVVFSVNVNAASPYDDLYLTTDRLYLGIHQQVDITERYIDIVNDTDNLAGFPVGTDIHYMWGNNPATESQIQIMKDAINSISTTIYF